MSTVSTIAVVLVTVGSGATLGAAIQNDWGGMGEFKQSMSQARTFEGCEDSVRAVAWSSGIGAQSIAQTRALVGWSIKAKRHGNIYSSWHNAKRRNVVCLTLAHDDAKCIVLGRPCQRDVEAKPGIDFDHLF